MDFQQEAQEFTSIISDIKNICQQSLEQKKAVYKERQKPSEFMQSWNSKAKDVPQDKNQSKLKRLKRAEDKVN